MRGIRTHTFEFDAEEQRNERSESVAFSKVASGAGVDAVDAYAVLRELHNSENVEFEWSEIRADPEFAAAQNGWCQRRADCRADD